MKLCGFEVGLDQPIFLIAGPCVIESEQLALDTAGALKEMTAKLGIPFIYKSSFDKANRSSTQSFRGPGMDEGLRILQKVKEQIGVPVLTDVHEDTPLAEVAAVIGETIGQEITYTDVPVEQLQQVLAGAGVPAPMDAVLADVDRGIAAGELLVPTTDLETLLGRPATGLRQAIKEALV